MAPGISQIGNGHLNARNHWEENQNTSDLHDTVDHYAQEAVQLPAGKY